MMSKLVEETRIPKVGLEALKNAVFAMGLFSSPTVIVDRYTKCEAVEAARLSEIAPIGVWLRQAKRGKCNIRRVHSSYIFVFIQLYLLVLLDGINIV